jgi:hypothetical protein
MISKIIHYCWLSDDPVPQNLQKYMATWRKYLPEYKFIKWDFKRFPKGKSKWVDQAFENKKYAFASDYIRLYALYNYGGIYLDMDVEVVRPYGNLLLLKTMLGHENSKSKSLEVAAFGVERHSEWIKKCLEHYNQRTFVNSNGTFNDQPLPGIIKNILIKNGYELKDINTVQEALNIGEKEIPVFPYEYFSPKNQITGRIKQTKNTYTIHHFTGSWLPRYQQIEMGFWHSLGLRDMRILLRIHNLIKYGSIRSVPLKSKKNKTI